MKSYSNTVSEKENDNAPETKVLEYCYLTDREFKVAVFKKLNALKENSEHSMIPGMKLMNKSTLSKKLKL